MARVLIIGGGGRGLALARELAAAGHAVRVTTRSERKRAAIEDAGAECWIGDPDRIGTLRQALDGVTVACWLLGTAEGDPEAVAALHGSRLQFMLGQLIDTTVRGLVYETRGTVPAQLLADGAERVVAHCTLHSIPWRLLEADPRDVPAWTQAALRAIDSLLEVASSASPHT